LTVVPFDRLGMVSY